MKEITFVEYTEIKKQAEKYRINANTIRVYGTPSDYSFLVDLGPATSSFELAGFQHALAELLTHGGNLEVLTEDMLQKRVQSYRLTTKEVSEILRTAQSLDEFAAIESSSVPPTNT